MKDIASLAPKVLLRPEPPVPKKTVFGKPSPSAGPRGTPCASGPAGAGAPARSPAPHDPGSAACPRVGAPRRRCPTPTPTPRPPGAPKPLPLNLFSEGEPNPGVPFLLREADTAAAGARPSTPPGLDRPSSRVSLGVGTGSLGALASSRWSLVSVPRRRCKDCLHVRRRRTYEGHCSSSEELFRLTSR